MYEFLMFETLYHLHLFDLNKILFRRACGHVDEGTCPYQVLAATLDQPRGADYAHLPYTGVFTKFWKPQAHLILSKIHFTGLLKVSKSQKQIMTL